MISTACRPSPEEMYRALVARDAGYDGLFVAAIRTTGIFCRPTCPARKPRFENVTFFGSNTEARRAGFRPCKRCRPEESSPPAWVRDLMAAVDRDPARRYTDDDLRRIGVEPTRARRYFRAEFGETFQSYHRKRRLGAAMGRVGQGAELSAVAYQHGFESESGFRDAFARLFGEPPGRARSAGTLAARHLDTPLGPMLAAASDDGVCLLEFADRSAMAAQVAALRTHFPQPVIPGSNVHLDRLADELADYFAGARTEFTVPLVDPGTSFQMAVWEALRAIPHGQTTSYGAIARAIGQPRASQAVGRANGQNRLALLIPCHRVVRADGHLCGYAAGLRRKQWLLDLERRVSGESGGSRFPKD